MHGIIKPQASQDSADSTDWSSAALGWARRNQWFLIIVMLPTLLVALYYYVVAADQYQSEAHFVVRTGDNSPTPSSGLGQFLGMGGGISQSRSDAMSAPGLPGAGLRGLPLFVMSHASVKYPAVVSNS